MTTTHELVGGSLWQRGLYRHLTAHAENEAGLLAAYQRAARESHSGAFRYLAAMILEDEERHHRLFCDLAQTLQTEADERFEEFAIPPLGQWGFERTHISELTTELLVQEHADARDLAELAGQCEAVDDGTMWHLLIQLMQADTAKHIEILEFVRCHAAA